MLGGLCGCSTGHSFERCFPLEVEQRWDWWRGHGITATMMVRAMHRGAPKDGQGPSRQPERAVSHAKPLGWLPVVREGAGEWSREDRSSFALDRSQHNCRRCYKGLVS